MTERFMPRPGFESTPDGIGLYTELAANTAGPVFDYAEREVPVMRRVIIEDLRITGEIGGFTARRMADAQIAELRSRGYFPPAPESDSTEPSPAAA